MLKTIAPNVYSLFTLLLLLYFLLFDPIVPIRKIVVVCQGFQTSTSSPLNTTKTTNVVGNGINNGGSESNGPSSKIVLRLGFLMANGTDDMRNYYGFGQSAPAVQLAAQKAQQLGLLDSSRVAFEYFWRMADCDHVLGVGYTTQMIRDNRTDVIFGSPCSTAAISSADVSTYYNILQLVWGATSATSLAATSVYPTLVMITPITAQPGALPGTALCHNLMDYVLGMVERYASSLENDVEKRTRELLEEKKKSDILLSRMLPRQVVEKLKAGEAVEPEHFPSATVFFSDIVRFTALASKCTPLQMVVNVLNTLYTGLDNLIEMHDVYKVETIGDGYLVVSGVPRRNGDRHIAEIARLSFAFMRYIAGFRIEHLPGERVQLRIGFHTGPVVAGVLGLAMPRYCLFGDTVNTASRMESNGIAGRIHISATSNYCLLFSTNNNSKNYRTESRGEVIIKGKGVMEMFWLLEGHPSTTSDESSNYAYRHSMNCISNSVVEKIEPFEDRPDDVFNTKTSESGSDQKTMYNAFKAEQ